MNDQFSVLCFRFKSGEEILAELVDETSTHYTIAKACQVQIRPGADAIGKQTINIGLVPWLPFAKNPKELIGNFLVSNKEIEHIPAHDRLRGVIIVSGNSLEEFGQGFS